MKATVGHVAVMGHDCQDQVLYVAKNRNKRYLCSACKKNKYIHIYIHTYIYSDLNGYSRKRDRYITDFQEGKVN